MLPPHAAAARHVAVERGCRCVWLAPDELSDSAHGPLSDHAGVSCGGNSTARVLSTSVFVLECIVRPASGPRPVRVRFRSTAQVPEPPGTGKDNYATPASSWQRAKKKTGAARRAGAGAGGGGWAAESGDSSPLEAHYMSRSCRKCCSGSGADRANSSARSGMDRGKRFGKSGRGDLMRLLAVAGRWEAQHKDYLG
eukprot:gene17032-biopygen14372